MIIIKKLAVLFVLGLTACKTIPNSYFTVDTRNMVEQKAIPVSKLQFYVDKDLELRRELSSREAKVNSGKIIFESGKYINIILLKAGTLGVCTRENSNSLDIAFESGDGKDLKFSVPERASSNTVYTLTSDQWVKNYNNPEIGKITYDNEVYFMRYAGTRPKLMIKKSANDKFEMNKRVMKGRKID